MATSPIPNVDELEFREDADYVYICEKRHHLRNDISS